VRDIKFSNDGSRFVSAGYDRFIRLWDTETGQCINTFTNRKMPYCCTFYPEDNDMMLAGCSDNRVCSMHTITMLEEYNGHMQTVFIALSALYR
jgi:pre-mRNA-processing factor 17